MPTPSPSKRLLFVPFGSEGDVNPLLWLAEGMAARGWQPEFLITPHYARLVRERGFVVHPIGTEEDFQRFARNPDLWHPQRGPRMVLHGMRDTLAGYGEVLNKLPGDFDLVVTSSIGLAAGSWAEARGIPHLRVHMQPICLRSVGDCPLFLDELAWMDRSPRWVKKLFFALTDQFVWNLARGPLNRFRRQLGLPPLKNFYEEALNGADGVAALFPDWFAPPQPDWPRQVRSFGFPVTREIRPLPSAVRAYLEAGRPPLIWTHGSANFDMQHFQRCAMRASRALGERCLLVSLDSPSGPLPEGVAHFSHVRFEDLFPHCRLAIHHGGIGTTAKAILAGIPQLIVPRSHDQPDNGRRIQRLGLGAKLHYRDLDSPVLEQTLRHLLASPSLPGTCLSYQAKMQSDTSLAALVTWTEELIARQPAR